MGEQTGQVESPRILWVAALTLGAAEAAVLAVREAAVRWLHPSPDFAPLTMGPPILDTFLFTVAAILVFAKVAYHENPIRLWRRVAAAALILSFIPDVMLAVSHSMGGDWPEAYALMAMHVVVWAICITLLPALAFTRRAAGSSVPERPLSIL